MNYPGSQEEEMVQEKSGLMYQKAELNLAEYATKKKIDTEAAVDREKQRTKVKLAHEYDRMYMQEQHKEINRARYEKVSILSNGSIELSIENSFVPLENRSVTNFTLSSLYRLKNEEGEDFLIEMNCQLESRSVCMILDCSKAGRPEYLMKKLVEAGLQIRIAKRQDRINVLNCLWTEILNTVNKAKIVPTKYGWTKYKDRYIFREEGDVIWEELLKHAK